MCSVPFNYVRSARISSRPLSGFAAEVQFIVLIQANRALGILLHLYFYITVHTLETGLSFCLFLLLSLPSKLGFSM